MEKPPKVKASPNGFEKITIRLFSVFVCFCSDHRSQTYSKQNDRFSTQICQPSFWASIYYRYAGRATGFWDWILLYVCIACPCVPVFIVPTGSPSRGGDVMVYAFWHKLTELAHSFSFCSCVSFCLYGPFNCVSFHKFSQQLSVFSLCSSGLISVS